MEYQEAKNNLNILFEDLKPLISDFTVLWGIYDDKIYNYNNSKGFREFEYLKNKKEKSYQGNKKTYQLIYQNIEKNEYKKKRLIELYNSLTKYIRDNIIDRESNKSEFEQLINFFNINIGLDKLVDEYLKNINDNINKERSEEKISVLLILMYRVRNNVFHGSKNPEKIKKQQELIELFCETLSCLIGEHIFKYMK